MKKQRLVKSQANPDIDSLINYITENKPFDVHEIMKYHNQLKQSLDQAVDLLHILEQLSKDNAIFKEYYHNLYETFNRLNNNIRIPNS
jgi:predicted nucleotidyltransferase